jgi:hypothetical protein
MVCNCKKRKRESILEQYPRLYIDADLLNIPKVLEGVVFVMLK